MGKFAFIGAGAVVTKPVLDYAFFLGHPGKQIRWMREFGQRLNFDTDGKAKCSESKEWYQLSKNNATKF
jgi:UDP-2-acetamido-3-amino-2,3-dideoxy-glucuronate N-acetyltransferase